jgi:hypothetical protein
MTNLEWLINENKLYDFLSNFEDTIISEFKHNLKEPAPLFTGKYPGLSRQGLESYRTFYICFEWLQQDHLESYISISDLKALLDTLQNDLIGLDPDNQDTVEDLLNTLREGVYECSRDFNPKNEEVL